MIPVLIGILLCLVISANIDYGELGHKPLQENLNLAAQPVWPDQQFTVDAAGSISPQQAEIHIDQTAV
jgi:hypothetical protein